MSELEPAEFYSRIGEHPLYDLRCSAVHASRTLPGALCYDQSVHNSGSNPVLLIPDSATLLPQLKNGFVLEGGYESLLQWQDSVFESSAFVVVGGKTGCGKTAVLGKLNESGEAVLDFEALAGHRGSAFGNLDGHEQPAGDFFRHLIFEKIWSSRKRELIWTEMKLPSRA